MIDRNYKYKKYKPISGNRSWYRSVYLKSLRWRKLRNRKLKQSPYCQLCGSNQRLDVHHCRYRTDLDLTIIDDLLTLCRKCHKLAHHSLTFASHLKHDGIDYR